ncbi:LysE family transporter [Paraburkholderia edwinii]|uniref:LysE family transporter n=1 Tax=Paraburkholderia edwinii TaxID=2861782 RepID=A0ABX8UGF1_9BURK|nr:LysE family transporter [Paraburkholderia edwinii]QYD67956.1 LysE family transporter [Paraburkholderia edwinii]
MSYESQLLTVAGVMLLGCASPGPDLVAITSHAFVRRKAGLFVALGIVTSHVIWAALAVFGLGVILVKIAWLYDVIRIAGVVYLLYLGVKIPAGLGAPAADIDSMDRPACSRIFAYRRGLLVGMTNPKGAAFFGSLFVTVLPAHAPAWVHAATLGIVAAVSISWSCGMALLFSTDRVQSSYRRLHKPIQAVMGSILIGLGAKFALDH